MKEQVDWKYTACYTLLLFMFDACTQFIMQFLEIWQSNCLANHSFNDGFSASDKRSEGSVGKRLNRSVSINAVNVYYIYICNGNPSYFLSYRTICCEIPCGKFIFVIRATAWNLVCWAVTSKITRVTALVLVWVSVTESSWQWTWGCEKAWMLQ